MEREAVPPVALGDSCVDSTGAYLVLREHGVDTIAGAVELLCPTAIPTPGEFDVVADGLYLYELELEDDQLSEVLDLEAVERVIARGSRAPALA